MGEFRRAAALYKAFIAAALALALALAGCAPTPIKPSAAHIRSEAAQPDGAIPLPVQVAPVLPPPTPAPRPETYSVVVNNVRVQDLLFALARDARLNVDIHPGITGTVTLNAIDQTLPQLLSRIANQVDMRYVIENSNLIVTRDTPYLRIYRVDYVSLERTVTSEVSVSSQVSSGVASAGAGSAGSAQNNSTATIKSKLDNRFWTTLEKNIKDILRETDKIIPKTSPAAPVAQVSAQAQAAAGGPPGAAVPSSAPIAQQAVEFIEQASVIANPEAGVFNIRATSRQHEKIQEFLDQVLATAKRQVLIEATIAEVQLNTQYQRGIDWSRLRNIAGFQFQQSSAGTPAGINTNAFVASFAAPGANFLATLKLLESFGDVRVLSSPKLSVLNNQAAVLKVTDNIVYFVVAASTTATANVAAVTTFNTTPQTVPVGFVMTVVPQISDTDTVLLSVRPSITRLLRFVPDPNPTLVNIQNLVPETQTREIESILRVQSGQTAVLGGLMQDSINSTDDTIPGIRNIPGLGQVLAQRRDSNVKSELVIFLRPTVIRNTSITGDYRDFRSLLPGEEFFVRPNPTRDPAPR